MISRETLICESAAQSEFKPKARDNQAEEGPKQESWQR